MLPKRILSLRHLHISTLQRANPNVASAPAPPSPPPKPRANLTLDSLIASSLVHPPERYPAPTLSPYKEMLKASTSQSYRQSHSDRYNNSTSSPNKDNLYIAHFASNRNNSIATLQRPNGDAVGTVRAGQLGFKNANKSSSEAGYQVALGLINFIKKESERLGRSLTVELALKGFGQGRDAMFKALQGTDGDSVRRYISAISDRTPIKFGGDRPKKRRKL